MSVVHVAVAVIENDKGEILIQQRAEDTHQGGLWEFPGGKLEQHETVLDALKREIREELDITVESARPLIKISHDYGDREVILDVHRVLRWSGQPYAIEGQPVKWVNTGRLADFSMPAADGPIISAITLSPSYVITPPLIEDTEIFLGQLDKLLLKGETLFLYRVKSLTGSSHEQLIDEMYDRCRSFNARLMIHEKNACSVKADGLHLTEQGLALLENKSQLDGLLSVSCHSLGSLKKAQSIGADFAMLSPVEPTGSHPGMPGIGWDVFASIVEQVNIPVFALGGMDKQKIQQAWACGGQGVAGISNWWKD